MPDYRNIDLNLTPGLLTVNSSYAAKGRYIAGSNIRFFQRVPERIGGGTPSSRHPSAAPPEASMLGRAPTAPATWPSEPPPTSGS